MQFSKIETLKNMNELQYHSLPMCPNREADICPIQPESKTTVDSSNLTISQKDNYFLNIKNTQSAVGLGATAAASQSSYNSSQTYQSIMQDISHCFQTNNAQKLPFVQPLDIIQSVYLNPHHPINIHQLQPQMIHSINLQPQQYSPQIIASNSHQMYTVSSNQLMQQTPQPSYQQLQMMYNSYVIRGLAQPSIVQPYCNQSVGQLIVPTQEFQSHLEEIPTNSQYTQNQESLLYEKQTQDDSNRKTLDMSKHLKLQQQQKFYQEMQKGSIEQTNSCDDSSLSNHLINQRNQYRDVKFQPNSNKQQIIDTQQEQIKIKSSKNGGNNQIYYAENVKINDVEKASEGNRKTLKEFQSNQSNRSDFNKQIENIAFPNTNKNNNLNNDLYQLNTKRTHGTREAPILNVKKHLCQNKQENLDSFKKQLKSKLCLFRKIKNNDPQVKVKCSIINGSIFNLQESGSINQQINDIYSPQIHQIKALYTPCSFPLNQIGNNYISPKEVNECKKKLDKNEILQKKRKLNKCLAETEPLGKSSLTNSQINLQIKDPLGSNQKSIMCRRSTNYLNGEQKKTLNFYSSQENIKCEIQVNQNVSNSKSTCENNQNYKTGQNKNQQMNTFISNPENQVQHTQRSQDEISSEEIVQKRESLKQKAKLNYQSKQDKGIKANSAISGDFLQQYEQEEEWEDSFFKQMRQNTKNGGKSFFLVSNYKKKLMQQLNPEDQQILHQMKQSKKFNFSKNVIKQFLKVMNQEINYIYKLDDSDKTDKDDQHQFCKNQIEIGEVATQSNSKNDTFKNKNSSNNQPELLKKEQNMALINTLSPALHQTSIEIQANDNQFKSLKQNSKDKISSFQYTQIKNPSTIVLNQLRQNIKEFLTFNSYTHSSIKKIIVHNYYSLYFGDFLDKFCDEWISSGKTKYKNEQKIMIQFLKLCLRNRKLLIFLSQHDPSRDQDNQEENE